MSQLLSSRDDGLYTPVQRVRDKTYKKAFKCQWFTSFPPIFPPSLGMSRLQSDTPASTTPEPDKVLSTVTSASATPRDSVAYDDPEKSQETITAPEISKIRKYTILLILSFAQFFDIYNATATIIALPTVRAIVPCHEVS